MEIRDGFIVGIYNYCDSWCDRCAFTSRCQVFADMRETEAKLDPNLEQSTKHYSGMSAAGQGFAHLIAGERIA